MSRFLIIMTLLLVGWMQPSPTPTEPISLDNADRIEQLQQIGYEPDSIWAVAFSPDGTTLAIGGWELLQVWNLQTVSTETNLEVAGYSSIRELVFSSDGETLFVSGQDSGLNPLSVINWREQLWHETDYSGRNLSLSYDGTVLATSWGNRITLYDNTTLTEIHNMPHEGITYDPLIGDLAFSPDDRQIVSISGEEVAIDGLLAYPTLRLWDTHTGALLNQADADHELSRVAFSPDGTLIATGSEFGDITLWNVQTFTNVATLSQDEQSYAVRSLVFSVDSSLLISGYHDGTIRLWDVAARSEVGTLQSHTSGVSSLALNVDGTMLASASYDGTVRLWGVP